MKRLLLIALLLVFPVSAQPELGATVNPDGSVTLIVPPELVQKCNADGGCGLWSNNAIREQQTIGAMRNCGRLS